MGMCTIAAQTAVGDAQVPVTPGVSRSEFKLVDGSGAGLNGAWPVHALRRVLPGRDGVQGGVYGDMGGRHRVSGGGGGRVHSVRVLGHGS